MRKVRKYDREFRINAVKHYENSGKNLTEVAESLGIPGPTLNGWVKEHKQHGEQSFPGSGNIKPCNEEVYRLKRQLADVTMERDILKKAVAIFSKPKQ